MCLFFSTDTDGGLNITSLLRYVTLHISVQRFSKFMFVRCPCDVKTGGCFFFLNKGNLTNIEDEESGSYFIPKRK